MTIANVVELDPDTLKQSLVTFLSTKSTFKDYNFEGSALSTIIDLLVRNSHYMAYLAAMNINESFMDSAQLRESVVAHARKLSYVPNSRRAPKATVDLTIRPAISSGLPVSLNVNPERQFITNSEGKVYNFVSRNTYTAYNNSDGTFSVRNMEIYQGNLIRNYFEVTYNGPTVFEIPNINIDTTTLRVYVRENRTSTNERRYFPFGDITDLNDRSEVFFLAENTRGRYQIEFGDGVLGAALRQGNYVVVEYISVDDEILLNNARDFTVVTAVAGYNDVTVDTVIESNGGGERETKEEIRYRAPRINTAQKRAVTASDYAVLLEKNYAPIKKAYAWGGEKNPTPSYGRVFVAVIPHEGFNVTQSIKDIIVESVLKQFNVGPISITVVNAKKVSLETDIQIRVNRTTTIKTPQEIAQDVQILVGQWSDENLGTFERSFYVSNLGTYIENNSDSSLVNVDISTTMRLDFTPKFKVLDSYQFEFNNAIEPGTLVLDKVYLDQYSLSGNEKLQIQDESDGTLSLYRVINNNEFRLIKSGIGTVNYETGLVNIPEINFSYDYITVQPTEYNVKAKPKERSVVAEREYYLVIDKIRVVNR